MSPDLTFGLVIGFFFATLAFMIWRGFWGKSAQKDPLVIRLNEFLELISEGNYNLQGWTESHTFCVFRDAPGAIAMEWYLIFSATHAESGQTYHYKKMVAFTGLESITRPTFGDRENMRECKYRAIKALDEVRSLIERRIKIAN